MVSRGDMKKMGGTNFMCWNSIKSHTNLKTGLSIATLQQIARDMGVSKPTAERAVKWLLENEYVERGRKLGRAGTFKIKETIPMTLDGEVVAHGQMPYIPLDFGRMMAELEDYAKHGRLPKDSKINVTFNINVINQGDNGVIGSVQVGTSTQIAEVSDPEYAQQVLQEMRELTRKLTDVRKL